MIKSIIKIFVFTLFSINSCLAEGLIISADKISVINGEGYTITATIDSTDDIKFIALNNGSGGDLVDATAPYEWRIEGATNRSFVGNTTYSAYAYIDDKNILVAKKITVKTKNPIALKKIYFSPETEEAIGIHGTTKFDLTGSDGTNVVYFDRDGSGVTYKTKELNNNNPSSFISVSKSGEVTPIKEGRSYLIAMKDGLEARKIIEVKDFIKELEKYENPKKLSSSGGGSLNLFFLIFLSALSINWFIFKKTKN